MTTATSIIQRLLMLVVLIGAGAVLSACAAPQPGTPEAERAAMEERKDAVDDTVGDIPKWFIAPPQEEGALFATGTSTSGDLQLSMDKAVLNAKRSLADVINSSISSKMKEFLTETGAGEDTEVLSEVERITSNLITETNVAGYTRTKADIIPSGTQYRAYVLLRFPLGDANRILVKQVKDNKLVEARVRASKAFQELEQDIINARGGMK